MQLRRVSDAINQDGQHVVIFGERGVGKTSLSNIVGVMFGGRDFYAPRINCDSNDLFIDIWRKAFNTLKKQVIAYTVARDAKPDPALIGLLDDAVAAASGYLTPGEVVDHLELLAAKIGLAIIFDECDRLRIDDVKTSLADTIKTLSDQNIKASIVLVGVADNIDTLLEEHRSLERALVQVQMPRMDVAELEEILNRGTEKLQMRIEPKAKRLIADLSRGLPHYVHLLGRHAARTANNRAAHTITEADVWAAIRNSLEDASASIRSNYLDAVSSVQPDALFRHVLAACALAPANELGWFSVASVVAPLGRITGKVPQISGFTRHIGAFTEDDRGAILERTGKPHSYRYRFSNPLMQPYAVLRAIGDGIITGSIEKVLRP